MVAQKIHRATDPSTHLLIYLSVNPPFCISTYLSTSFFLSSIYLSISIRPSVCLSVCLSAYPPTSVCLSAYPPSSPHMSPLLSLIIMITQGLTSGPYHRPSNILRAPPLPYVAVEWGLEMPLWMYSMNVQHECTAWMYSMNVQHECTAWMYSMNVQHECAAWMYSMNVQHECMNVQHEWTAWMYSMNVRHECTALSVLSVSCPYRGDNTEGDVMIFFLCAWPPC